MSDAISKTKVLECIGNAINEIVNMPTSHDNARETHACVSEHTDMMTFPETIEGFMEQYKITDTEQIYTNGTELVPIFRIMQWFDHKPERKTGRWEFIGDQMFRCSECGHTFTQKFLEGWRESVHEPLFPPHCPSCGSYNGGEQE